MKHENFIDNNFILFNDMTIPTRQRGQQRKPLQSPDLSWWPGTRMVSRACEPDCRGSDHHPIYLELYPYETGCFRHLCRVVDRDHYHSESENVTNRTLVNQLLHAGLTTATRTFQVNESKSRIALQCHMCFPRLFVIKCINLVHILRNGTRSLSS